MKPRVEKTAFWTGFEAVSRLGHFSISVIRICFGFRIRNCGRLLPLALLLASWQFSVSATPTKSRDYAKAIPLANSFGVGVDGIDCITSENQEKQPSRDSNNSPEPARDIDESESGPVGLEADSSSRNDQDTSPFSVTGIDAVTLRAPGIIRIPLLPVNCFYCLHEHIRERAPPHPGIKI